MVNDKDSSAGIVVARRRKELWVKEGRGQPCVHPRVTISKLPEDVLLEIFDFYVHNASYSVWHTLVHVCQQWRCVVFASPRRLNLRLRCTYKTPVKEGLGIWPVIPIIIYADIPSKSRWPDATNIIAALNQRKRVCEIAITIPNSLLKKFAAMKEPFPALTYLELVSYDENVPVLPDSFLGGSAPRLQRLDLWGIPFPGLPKLLLTTSDLVTLALWDIPQAGYISPKAMVTSLSALTRLERLSLGFLSPRPRVDRPRHRLPTHARVIFPALIFLNFKGTSEYFEDIVSRIETPRLDRIRITFFNQLVFDAPQFGHFFSRTQILETPNRATILLSTSSASVGLFQQDGNPGVLQLDISCRALDWQLSSLAQVCSPPFPPFSTLECLEIDNGSRDWHEDVEHTQWLELLHPFVSVKDLIVSEKLVHVVSSALQELVGERVEEVLPALQNLFLKGPQPSNPVREAIVKFIVARRGSGHPVTVYHQGESGEEYVRGKFMG